MALAAAAYKDFHRHQEALTSIGDDRPQISISIPILVQPALLPLFCDLNQHSDDLRQGIRNLLVQVAMVTNAWDPGREDYRQAFRKKAQTDGRNRLMFIDLDVHPRLLNFIGLSQDGRSALRLQLNELEATLFRRMHNLADDYWEREGDGISTIELVLTSQQWDMTVRDRVILICSEGNKHFAHILEDILGDEQDSVIDDGDPGLDGDEAVVPLDVNDGVNDNGVLLNEEKVNDENNLEKEGDEDDDNIDYNDDDDDVDDDNDNDNDDDDYIDRSTEREAKKIARVAAAAVSAAVGDSGDSGGDDLRQRAVEGEASEGVGVEPGIGLSDTGSTSSGTNTGTDDVIDILRRKIIDLESKIKEMERKAEESKKKQEEIKQLKLQQKDTEAQLKAALTSLELSRQHVENLKKELDDAHKRQQQVLQVLGLSSAGPEGIIISSSTFK